MARHTARRLTSAAFGLTLIGGMGVAFAGAAQADPNKNITICHATASKSNPFVVITVDSASIVKKNGHDQHQKRRDVIPPFTYLPDNKNTPVSYPGLNWHENWVTNGEGVAADKGSIDKTDCAAPGGTTPPGGTTTPSQNPPPPTGPVVETDLVDPAGSNLGLVGGGAALLLAGAGATLAVARRRGSHS
ncbi:MAG: hypothetical protein ABIP45_06050 [Knoellia sp.]